jgi:hypothetical protein
MKEIFSEKVTAGSRTYFFDVKESDQGARYLVISESRQTGSTAEHYRVVVFEEHLEKFSEILDQAVWMMARSDKSKTYSLDQIRQKYPRDYEMWTSEEDERLTSRYQAGLDLLELAAIFQRQPSAIESRLTKLGLRPQG